MTSLSRLLFFYTAYMVRVQGANCRARDYGVTRGAKSVVFSNNGLWLVRGYNELT